jgi:hypothetical protein
MANHAANDLNYYLVVAKANQSDLARIRQWNNLKAAIEDDVIWVKDFNFEQISSIEIKSIPYKSLYYSKQNKLYLLNSSLPECLIPSLLWTPIDRALPISLPSFNHNYFGVPDKIAPQLVASDQEEKTVAIITSISSLKDYIKTAPAIRLERIRWVVLENERVLLMGDPPLPIAGDAFWNREEGLLPAGYDFELFSLSKIFNNAINPSKIYWVLWHIDNTYSLIPKDSLQTLSISSFRLTLK